MLFMEELKELFFKLAKVGAPSGFEEPMMRIFKSELEPLVDKTYCTPRGTVVGFHRGSNPKAPSIALAAHLDHVGFVVFNIEDEGFLRFRKLGHPVTRALLGQQMALLTENGPISGVVGIKPGHITKADEERIIPPIEEMYIDVGTWSREETEKLGCLIGTPIIYDSPPRELKNHLIASPAVDNKGGCAALIATARKLQGLPIPASIYYIGSVEEEVALRGAEVALHDIEVDLAIAVDTFPAGWQPEVNMRDLFFEVGKGPGIHIGHISSGRTIVSHHKVRKWLTDTAEQAGIPYQMGFMHGGTDAMAFMQTRSGIPSATLGLPRRYSHSPVEVFDLTDLNNLVRLLTTALQQLDANVVLNRI